MAALAAWGISPATARQFCLHHVRRMVFGFQTLVANRRSGKFWKLAANQLRVYPRCATIDVDQLRSTHLKPRSPAPFFETSSRHLADAVLKILI
jgi:hypothetical protein